jgi:hypothetical protein
VTAEVALVTPDSVPGISDWHPATWQGEEARWLLPLASYPVDGDYLLKVRLTAGSEQVVQTSARITLG